MLKLGAASLILKFRKFGNLGEASFTMLKLGKFDKLGETSLLS